LFWKRILIGTAAILGSSQASIEESLSASYAPFYVDCPTDIELVRRAKCLNPGEADWVQKRKRVVHGALKDYLHRLDLKDFNVHEYVHRIGTSDYENVPILGMTISGGGYRSGFTGAGAIRALDSRLPSANDQKTGGLLQSLTYLAGQSGGAWPVLGLPTHDFPTIDEMMIDWHTDIDRTSTVNSTYIGSSTSIFKDLAAKYEAGFPITVSDYLGRLFAYEFLPQGLHGALNVTMSSIRNQSNFLSHEMPISIVQATALEAGDAEYFGLKVPYSNSTNVSFRLINLEA
jgi:lysophospholipase